MQATWAICRRDVRAAFSSPLMWLVLAAWMAVLNFIFYYQISSLVGKPIQTPQPLYLSALSWGVGLLALLAPALTMNAFASERSQGTMQLLLTAPVREHELVAGKYLASMAMLSTLVLATLIHPLVLMFISQVPVPQLLCGYAALLLASSLYAAFGVWISLLVDHAVSAYVLTFAGIVLLYLVGLPGSLEATSGPWTVLGDAIGLEQRTAPFFQGDLRLGGVCYFLGGSALFILLAHPDCSAHGGPTMAEAPAPRRGTAGAAWAMRGLGGRTALGLALIVAMVAAADRKAASRQTSARTATSPSTPIWWRWCAISTRTSA